MRRQYWSCTKFADWIRGTPKIQAGTSTDWKQWEQAARKFSAVRYWLAEEGLDKLQDLVSAPSDAVDSVRYYINNRFITKSHALTAHPRDIKPGTWMDVGNRFLPCLFNELVDFVEIEQAWHHVMWNEEEAKKFEVPWYRRKWLRLRTWRCPEAGLAYLDWASSLVWDETWGVEPDNPNYGKPTHQALGAKEIKELYIWWTQVYRNRPDPMDASGWSDYCEFRRSEGLAFLDSSNDTPETKAMCNTALDRCSEIERAYAAEDEEMMIRLIKVRERLWT